MTHGAFGRSLAAMLTLTMFHARAHASQATTISIQKEEPQTGATESEAQAAAAAREQLLLQPGVRLRALGTLPDSEPVIGRLLHSDGQTLVLALGDGSATMELRRSSIKRLEVSLGRGTHVIGGAVLGALLAGTTAALAGVKGCSPQLCFNFPHAVRDATLGAVGGALAGAVFGQALPTEDWAPVVTHQRVGLNLAPAPTGGATATLSIRF